MSNTDYQVGDRVLYCQYPRSIPVEAIIEEISPSGKFVKLRLVGNQQLLSEENLKVAGWQHSDGLTEKLGKG